MKKTVLLINAKTKGPYRPTGLEYLAEAVSNAGICVVLLDLALEQVPVKAVLSALDGKEYRAIGVSIFNTQWDTGRDKVEFFLPEIKAMIADIRKHTTSPIVLGGHGFSLQPEDTLVYLSGDYGVDGCGIPAFVELLNDIEEKQVPRGTIVRDDRGEYLDFGFKRNLVDPSKYSKQEEVFVSVKRGCAERCIHCPTIGTKFRLRKPQRIAEEVKNLVKQGIERISFMHCTFNIPPEHAHAICEAIKGLPIQWSTYIHPAREFLSPELVDIMKASGMVRADIGGRMIGSDEMLMTYNVRFRKKDIEYATKLFKAKGIGTFWFMGFGAPGESRATIDETFSFIDKVRPDSVAMFTRTRVYKNSSLGKLCVKEGIVDADDRLLEPVYYLFSDELRDYIFQQGASRANCVVLY